MSEGELILCSLAEMGRQILMHELTSRDFQVLSIERSILAVNPFTGKP